MVGYAGREGDRVWVGYIVEVSCVAVLGGREYGGRFENGLECLLSCGYWEKFGPTNP